MGVGCLPFPFDTLQIESLDLPIGKLLPSESPRSLRKDANFVFVGVTI
jgi:hypothetical protein